jgi:hypothetical protein
VGYQKEYSIWVDPTDFVLKKDVVTGWEGQTGIQFGLSM